MTLGKAKQLGLSCKDCIMCHCSEDVGSSDAYFCIIEYCSIDQLDLCSDFITNKDAEERIGKYVVGLY